MTKVKKVVPSLIMLCLTSIVLSPVFGHEAHSSQSLAEFRSGGSASAAEYDFELVGKDLSTVQMSDFLGQNVLVTFGFTSCPDVCPVVAASMSKALGMSEKQAVGIFISVDTERDTPQEMGVYAGYFGEHMVGLTGSHEQVAQAAKNFNATFVVSKTPDSYSVQHSPGIYLISPEGEFLELFALNADPNAIVAAMQ